MGRIPLASPLAALVCLCTLELSAAAQIDLPEKPVEAPPAPAAPELPELPRGRLAERETGRSPYEEPGQGEDGGLQLPPGSPAGTAPASPASPEAAPTPMTGLPAGRADAAAFILAELRRIEDLRHPLIDSASQSLSSLGVEGLEAARRGLTEEKPATILACAKVLLVSPEAADRELVRRRLRSKLPASVGGPLLDAFATLDPVAASPSVLAGLLDHPLVGVRAAVSRRLEAKGVADPATAADPQWVQSLRALMRSTRIDTRLRALELLAASSPSEIVEDLLACLRDPAANVAGRAAVLLAARDEEALVGELRRRAFDQPWILRENAYAVLALIEREDSRVSECLDERHVDVLREGMRASDPFVAGTCAAALAGIGFRSPTLESLDWLDRDVPERLVRCVGGVEFHNDFSSLQRTAARRLNLISGQAFGSDGPSWMKWWSENRGTFLARRAVIEAKPEWAASLRVEWRDTRAGLDGWRLLGPTARQELHNPADPESVEVLRISERQARDLFLSLEEHGVFGSQRLPGVRGASSLTGRSLDVAIAGRGKSFRFAGSASEPWFDKLESALSALRDRNRWQRYPSPRRHATSEDLWFEQAQWWDETQDESARALRMKALVLEALPARALERREGGLAELARVYANPELVEADDFATLLALLRDEPFFSPRAETVLGLCLAHLGPQSPNPTEGSRGGGEADVRAEHVISVALERFGERASDALARVLPAAGPAAIRHSARDPRPVLRAVCVKPLIALGDIGDLETALGLLNDPSPSVQIAAVVGLGEAGIEAARAELLQRARIGEDPTLRAAAIGAVANLGGEGAMDVMVLGLASPSAAIKVASARGLARLGDPACAPLLVSLLGQGRGSDLFEAARQGLLALGDGATNDLLRAIHTPGHRARREGSLLLAQQGVPQVVPILLALLTETPNDSWVASELAILTCVDHRSAGDPATVWWDWWDGVVHDDSRAWLCAALERLGEKAPPPAELAPPGSRAGLRFLTHVLRRSEAHLVERARREIGRLLGRDLGPLPMPGEARDAWLAALDAEVLARFPQ